MNKFLLSFLVSAGLFFTGCDSDNDAPELPQEPEISQEEIDASKIVISAKISTGIKSGNLWCNPDDEIMLKVADIDFKAPEGVILQSITLLANGDSIANKPYSGKPLEFYVYTKNLEPGNINFSIIGNLIKKDARDAQIIIKDNISKIIFSEVPEFERENTVDVTVKSISSSGEEYNNSFQASAYGFDLFIPSSEIYWTPKEGDAKTVQLTLTANFRVSSTNSTLNAKPQSIYWNGESSSTINIEIPNTPGSLKKEKLSATLEYTIWGKWENVNIGNVNFIAGFAVSEK